MASIKTLAVLATLALGAVAFPAEPRDEAPSTTPSVEVTFAKASIDLKPSGQCGPTKCGPGLVCCNESCGICTPPRGLCITLWCGEPALSI
ncbi:hypothetical protein ACHAQA_004343 [Verticillium albo-atrum]